MSAPYTLRGIWLSGPTYKVGLMLAMTGQKFDYELVNLREGAHQTPDYKSKSRWAQVPCLTINATGQNLVQSAAILGYLAATTGKMRGATDADQQHIREWLLWSADRLAPPIYRCRAAKAGFRQQDAATTQMYVNEGNAALKSLDDQLKGHTWAVGSSASIADIDLYGVIYYAADGGFDLSGLANIAAWKQRFEALPGFGKPDQVLPKESRKSA